MMDLSIKEISIENEKINREKFFSVGFCPEIQRYLLCVHISWVVGYDRYYAIDEEDIALYEESPDEFCQKYAKEINAYRTERLLGAGALRDYDMLRKQREELLEDVPNEPDAAPVPDDAAVSTDNIERLTELIGQMKPMYRDPLRLLAMGYTNREIAKSLGLTDEVVRTRLFRGRKLLWKEMNSHE